MIFKKPVVGIRLVAVAVAQPRHGRPVVVQQKREKEQWTRQKSNMIYKMMAGIYELVLIPKISSRHTAKQPHSKQINV